MKRFLVLACLCIALCACGGGGDGSKAAAVSSVIKVNADDYYGGLAAAVSAIGSTPTVLIVSSSQTVSGNLTVPSNITLQVLNAASIAINSGKTLTINGLFEAGLYQVFTGSGVVAGNGFLNVRPEWFGTGLPAMLAAYNIAITGIPLELSSTQTYDMGSVSPGATLLPSINAKLRVIGNGATITMSTNATGQTHLFDLINPVYAKFENITFSDAGADISQTWRGAHFVYVSASGSTNGYGNIVFSGVKTTSGVSPLTVFGTSATSRIENIKFEGGCVFTNTYYGPLFQNQGDNFTGEWTCNNCRRAYYPYGVRNHDVTVKVYHDGGAYYGSTGAIEIVSNTVGSPAYSDTRNIRVRVTFSGSVANYGSCVNFILIGASGAKIDDVHVDLNLTDAIWTGGNIPVLLEAYDTNGGTRLTTTDNSWNNIHLSGDFLRGTGILGSIAAATVQNTTGNLIIDNVLSGNALPSIPGFTTVYNSSR